MANGSRATERTLQSEYLLPLLCFIRPLIYFWLAFFLFSWFLFVGYNASPFDLVQSIQFFRIPVITRLERRNKKNEREGEWVSERDCRRRFTEAKDIHISPTGSKWKKLVVFPVDMEWNASPSETSLRNGTDSQPDKKKTMLLFLMPAPRLILWIEITIFSNFRQATSVLNCWYHL